MVLIDCGWSASLADIFAPQIKEEAPDLWWLLFFVECLAELVFGLYIADMVSGLVHLALDYEVGKNDELRRHAENTIADVKEFKRTNPLFLMARARDQYLW